MASLTPQHRSDEVVDEVMKEGLINGGMTFIPCMGALYLAMKNPNFRKFTNWQSRTALVLMPTLFVFALTAEQKMVHRMEEVAEETEHTIKSVHWAERQYQLSPEDIKLHDLYRKAILNSGIRVVEGDQLAPYHNVANYVQANPFKVIMGVGLPAVGAIFYGRVGKEHLSMQLKILHTRVFGQFAIICTLLGVMGLKATMDHQGRYVTEDEVERRVAEMQDTRIKLLHRIDEVNATMPHKHVPHHAKEGSDDHAKAPVAHA